MKASSKEAFKLMMEGSAVLTDVEEHGMRIDVGYLDRTINEADQKIKDLINELKKDDVYKIWRKMHGERTNLGSRHQLGNVVFNELGVECKHKTKTGKPKTDEEALEEVDHPFVKRWVNVEKLKKTRNTFLAGIRREVDYNGFLHPHFNQHIASTHRLSSTDPNFQNLPIRDPRQAKLIRRAFVPRGDKYILVEIDYSALEFKGAAFFWKDQGMIEYASDPSLDIHRDMAAECYDLAIEMVTKQARSFAKNQFVFPILYGSYYVNCAANLWQNIGRAGLTTADGTPLYDHLAKQGITELGNCNPKKKPRAGTYEKLIKGVEDRFNERFPTWSEEKEKWWDLYLKRGWFEILTGFVCKGIYSRNNLMNTPIQGPCSHLLLWSLIELNKWLKKNKMRSKIIGTIHDSIEMDVHEDEFDDVIAMAHRIMTKMIREHWKWIVVPLDIEVEVSRTNWYEKKPYELAI